MNQTKLQLSLLGGLTITENDTAVSNFISRKAEALFVYLACNPRSHSRATLATLFWPNNNQTSALANLSVALSSLRKKLQPYLWAERHTLGIKTESNFVLDTAVFQQSIAQARETQKQRGKLDRSSAARLATAVSLYKGDFLAGFSIRGAPEFEAWALLEQERLRQMLLNALADLITFHQERQQFDDGIRYAQLLLTVDSLQEGAHRQLMTMYIKNNQRTAALAQYEKCVQILDEELGVEPNEEIAALYAQIVAGQELKEQERRDESTQFPPLPRPSAPQHNLAVATTTFIGRQDDLARIKLWLGEPNGRLLTIVGPGGMGKTRLAQEAARATVGQFVDGVWYVSLVGHTDMDGVITAVAETINFTFSKNAKQSAQLLNYLQTREMLLVLDNLEHLLIPQLLTFITQLTEQAPDLRLIATSRERLHLQAETLLNLRGLSYLEPHSLPESKRNHQYTITASPAVQLFVNRALRIRSEFKVVGEETAVIQLCQLVGGLPLALELAATWTRILAVSEIVTEIQRGLDTLTTTLHDLPPRHRSIRAVIETSWHMLPANEQTQFRKLSIFRDGFTRDTAQQVANATLPQLMSLVDRSFLRLDADQRFRRHPLLLQFAQEQLATHPDEQTQTQAAHAHFFAAFMQAHEHALLTSDAPAAMKAIGIDLENSRVAWQWALQNKNLKLIHQITPALYTYLINTSQVTRGFALFEAGVHQLANIEFDNAAIIWLHCAYGFFASLTSDTATADKTLVKCVVAARRIQHKYLTAFALSRLGVNSEHQGKIEEAQQYLGEALQLAEQLDNPYFLASRLLSLAIVEWERGAIDLAKQHTLRSMKLADEFNYKSLASTSRYWLGQYAYSQQEYKRAIKHLQESQQISGSINNGQGSSITLHLLGVTWGVLGDHQRALAMKQQAIQMEADTGDVWHKALFQFSTANTLIELGRFDEAETAAQYGVQLTGSGMPLPTLSSLATLGRVAAHRGELAKAVTLLTFSLSHPVMVDLLAIGFQELLDSLKAEMPPQLFEQAVAEAAKWTLEEIVRQI